MKALPKRLALGLLALSLQVQAADALRPEVGKPLQEAQTLIQGKKYKDALAKVNEAQGIGSLTPYESYIIERMKSAAATGAGDYAGAVKSYEAVLASPQLQASEKIPTLEAIAKLTYASKNYSKAVEAIQKYQAAGGSNAQVTGLLPQAYYLAGSYAEAQKAISQQIQQTEKAGQAPSEDTLKLLASTALKQNDSGGYVTALEKLVQYHPTPNYWLDLISRTSNKPGFSDRLTLDLYRLRLKTKTLDKPGDYMEATQLALQAGLPGEAEQFLKKGYEAKALGQGSPQDIDRHKRLSDLVARKLTEDKATLIEGEKAAANQATGDGLVATGLNYVGYGDTDKGIALIQQGIQKGGLKRPEEAKLNLGYAQLQAGKTADAVKTLKAVQGTEGTADLAKLWMLSTR